MITIYHGDNTSSSRTTYIDDKSKVSNPIVFYHNGLNPTDFTQACSSDGLFTESKTICLELFFSKTKSKKIIEEIVSIINANQLTHNFLLWEDNTLTKSQISNFPKSESKLFKLPQMLFQFLDSLNPRDIRNSINLFNQTATSTNPEIVFAMLIRHIRILLALSTNDEIEETKKLADWQRSKLIKQASQFTKKQLKSLHNKLFLLDSHRKTSKMPNSLQVSIDFLLLSIYH